MRNETVYVGGYQFRHMIEVDHICTDDGDSGGPLVTPAGQVQGTVTGGTRNSCPDSSSDLVIFQPISATLSRAQSELSNHPIAMLTSHGRSAPTLSSFLCPDHANSGGYNGHYAYTCDFTSFDSQGITAVSWTSNTGASSDSEEIFDNCTAGQTVNVSLTVSNPYGTLTQNRSFACPTHPIP